jgi:large subunit ribosomal protein L19
MEITSVNIEARKNLDMKSGDTVKVFQKIKDKEGKVRIQLFEGLVLARKHGTEAGATFTVRRVTGGFGVEKIFPLFSPMIEKIEVTKRSKIRRSKLYHVRDKAIKQANKRMKMIMMSSTTEIDAPEEAAAPAEAAPVAEEMKA